MRYYIYYPPELYHHGIKGMRWGVRRYQNYDGSRIGTTRIVGTSPGLPSPSSLGGAVRVEDSRPRHRGKRPIRRQSLKKTAFGYSTGHYLRNKLNKDLPQNDADAKEKGWRKLSDKDSSMHQFHQEDGVKNSKWVSPDGHREVVFTGKGENQHITVDPRDQGTYNFFDPKKYPLGHAVFDVMPYVVLGNSMDDSTVTFDRIYDSAMNFIKNKSMDDIDESSVAMAKKKVGW